MIKGYKYRLDPIPEQIVQMEKTFGCCRYVYNWALDLKIKTYQGEKRSMSAVDLCKQLTLLKKDENHLWLNEVSNECLQQSKLSDRVWTCPECGAVNDRDLLAANNIKKFGLEKQNLLTQENINKTPVVNREGDVELPTLVGTVKRQNVLV